jgi:signal transduction histidine kinase
LNAIHKTRWVLSRSPALSDRIKEALLNLVTNACEAMENGGQIHILETREHDPILGDVAVITRVS